MRSTSSRCDEDYHLGVLSSTAHTAWAWERSSTLKGDLRYTPTTAFATFPWPDPIDDDLRAAVGDAAHEIVHLRSQHCAEGGFGLTHLYNVMDDGGYRDLAACHLRLDRAVTACYGWSVKFAQDRGELSCPSHPPERRDRRRSTLRPLPEARRAW